MEGALMRNISAEAKALALAPARRISARAIVTHLIDGKWGTEGDIYNQNDKLQSLSISLGSNSGGFTVGETYCGKLTLTLIGDDLDIRQDDRVHIVLGFFDDIKGAVTFKSTYSGYFFVDKITRNKKLTTVVAFDKMLRFSKNYISKLTYPALLSEMLAELSEQCATELADDVAVPYDAQIKSAPIKGTDKAGKKIYYTRREMLGYCAALCGSSFFMDNNDKLALVTNADCSETILPENTTSETHEPLEFEITEVVWSEDGNSVMRDDINTAGIVEFANPLDVGDKEQALKAISAKIVGLKYFEAAIKGQGKGWYELGDVVSVKISDSQTIKIRISGINYEVKNGAFTETLYSSALTESQSNYTSGDVSGGAGKPTYGGTSAGTLTEYNVLSDTSVKYNGVTYTAELAGNGLISKITDDKGGEFEPTYADGLTSVALHNAAFLAVTMISGLGSVRPWSGVFSGLAYQLTDVVTSPGTYNTNLGDAPNEFTIEVCMQFDGVGNTSSNQSCTIIHLGAYTGENNMFKIATCDYHDEAFDYEWGGEWNYDVIGDYTTFPSHKGELSTSTLVIVKTGDGSEIKVYSNGELRDTNAGNWQSADFSNVKLLSNKYGDRDALGTIYQVRIYNRALTDAEVAQNASEDRRCYG